MNTILEVGLLCLFLLGALLCSACIIRSWVEDWREARQEKKLRYRHMRRRGHEGHEEHSSQPYPHS
jgi:hypothetical protein